MLEMIGFAGFEGTLQHPELMPPEHLVAKVSGLPDQGPVYEELEI